MFLNFFYALRASKIKATTAEYLDLIKIIEEKQKRGETISPNSFYQFARNCLVKDIKYYDQYDLVFSQVFGDVVASEFSDKLKEWLNKAVTIELSEVRKKNALEVMDKDLINELKKRLKEQKERHDTGNKWIGTGGTSPFGHSGYNPNGIRVGGSGGGNTALAVAGQRHYQEYRSDETLDTRQIKLALKKLRELKHKGRPEIHINKSIKQTCDNGGEIELVLEKKRKNNLKLILLMDVGGSMTPYANQVSKLFSSAHQVNHFKEFKYYYFHNIFYDKLYTDATMLNSISFESVIKKYDAETRFIIVGDAAMAPYELFEMTGGMREFYFNFIEKNGGSALTGFERVEQIKRKFPKTVWLNPEIKRFWNSHSVSAIASKIEMFRLTLNGLDEAVRYLKI